MCVHVCDVRHMYGRILYGSSRDVHFCSGDFISTTRKRVVGDRNAYQVLDCLSYIATLYGEHIILLQYLQHVKELVILSD